MVKLHDGFINDEMAILALNYCQMYYALQGFLVSSYLNHSCHSYLLSVHNSDREDFSILESVHPSCFEEDRVERAFGESYLVCHMYFNVESSNNSAV